jgi:hypothetical protein
VDAEEAQALRAGGLDPDDPAVIAAIDLVRWELSLGNLSRCTCPKGVRAPCPRDHKRHKFAELGDAVWMTGHTTTPAREVVNRSPKWRKRLA